MNQNEFDGLSVYTDVGPTTDTHEDTVAEANTGGHNGRTPPTTDRLGGGDGTHRVC